MKLKYTNNCVSFCAIVAILIGRTTSPWRGWWRGPCGWGAVRCCRWGLSAYQGDYRLSYLVALLLWPGPAVLVVPQASQARILMGDLPRLQDKLGLAKPIQVGDRWPDRDFAGVLVTTPEAWLADRLQGAIASRTAFRP